MGNDRCGERLKDHGEACLLEEEEEWSLPSSPTLVERALRYSLGGYGYECQIKKLGKQNDAPGRRMEKLLGGKVLA